MSDEWHNSGVYSFIVGGDHIDQYEHVNYKAMPVILEPAQDQLLAESGTSFDDIEKRFGLRSVVKTFTTTCHDQLKKGERARVVTKLKLGYTSITFHQLLSVIVEGSSDRAAVEQQMVVVLVNDDGKQLIPQTLRNMLVEGT